MAQRQGLKRNWIAVSAPRVASVRPSASSHESSLPPIFFFCDLDDKNNTEVQYETNK